MKPRRFVSAPLLVMLVGSLLRGGFRKNSRGMVSGEDVGYGVAVVGGVLAVIGLVGLLFVPVATFTILDGELFALFGALGLVIGVIIRQASV